MKRTKSLNPLHNEKLIEHNEMLKSNFKKSQDFVTKEHNIEKETFEFFILKA